MNLFFFPIQTFQLNYSKIKFNFYFVLDSQQIFLFLTFTMGFSHFSQRENAVGNVRKKERITSNMCGYFLIFPQYPHKFTKRRTKEKKKRKKKTDKLNFAA